MKRPFVVGIIGGFLGIATALYVIFSSGSSGATLSGVQAALFSSLGLMGAVIANTESRFAGWMLLSSAVWITLSVPLPGRSACCTCISRQSSFSQSPQCSVSSSRRQMRNPCRKRSRNLRPESFSKPFFPMRCGDRERKSEKTPSCPLHAFAGFLPDRSLTLHTPCIFPAQKYPSS